MKKNIILASVWMILAVISAFYGIIVAQAGSGTLFFLIWIILGIFFIFCAFFCYRGLWKKLNKKIKIIFYVAVAAGMTVFMIIEVMIARGFACHGEPNLDYIIVLGAQVLEDGPSAVLRYRLDEAVRYMNENEHTICIVSGGQGYNEPFSEAEGMFRYMKEKGIAEERILLESESSTTEENIRNSSRMIKDGASVGIITNDFHVFRAIQTAEAQGLKNVCGIAAGSNRLFLPNNMLREFFGEIKFLLTSYKVIA